MKNSILFVLVLLNSMCYGQVVKGIIEAPDFMRITEKEGCIITIEVLNKVDESGNYITCDEKTTIDGCFSSNTEIVKIGTECIDSKKKEYVEYHRNGETSWIETRMISRKKILSEIIVGSEIVGSSKREVFDPDTYESDIYITNYLVTTKK